MTWFCSEPQRRASITCGSRVSNDARTCHRHCYRRAPARPPTRSDAAACAALVPSCLKKFAMHARQRSMVESGSIAIPPVMPRGTGTDAIANTGSVSGGGQRQQSHSCGDSQAVAARTCFCALCSPNSNIHFGARRYRSRGRGSRPPLRMASGCHVGGAGIRSPNKK